MNGITRGVFELASTMLGIAVLTLLINRSSDTSKVISSASGSFNSLLKTLTLQGGGGGITWGA